MEKSRQMKSGDTGPPDLDMNKHEQNGEKREELQTKSLQKERLFEVEAKQQEERKSKEETKLEEQAVAKRPVGKLKWRKEDTDSKQKDDQKKKESFPLKVGVLKWKKEDSLVEEQVPDLESTAEPPVTSGKESRNSSPSGDEKDTTDELAASAMEIPLPAKEQKKKFRSRIKKNTESSSNKVDSKVDQTEKIEKKSLGRRMFRLFIKITWFPALVLAALVIGLMVGYGVLGAKEVDQDLSFGDVFDPELWKHLYNLING